MCSAYLDVPWLIHFVFVGPFRRGRLVFALHVVLFAHGPGLAGSSFLTKYGTWNYNLRVAHGGGHEVERDELLRQLDGQRAHREPRRMHGSDVSAKVSPRSDRGKDRTVDSSQAATLAM